MDRDGTLLSEVRGRKPEGRGFLLFDFNAPNQSYTRVIPFMWVKGMTEPWRIVVP